MSNTRFFEPPNYNLDGRQHLWVECCTNSHDTWCGCNYPAAHLLACLLPVGHKDRQLTVQQVIEKAFTHKWPSGGNEEEGGGEEQAPEEAEEKEPTIEDLEDAFGEGAIDELLAAAADDVTPR